MGEGKKKGGKGLLTDIIIIQSKHAENCELEQRGMSTEKGN